MVVMGHTIFPVHQVLSLFHMPLFFFLSGLTLRIYPSFENFFLKKIDRLFIPYVFFCIVSFLLARLFGYKGSTFNGPLWFLHSLFVSIILCEIVLKYTGNKTWAIAALLVFYSCFSSKIDYPLFPYETGIDRALRASVFVFAGYYLKDFIFSIDPSRGIKNDCLRAFLFTIIYGILSYLSIYIMGADGNFLTGSICKYNIIVFYLSSMCGILMIVYWSKWIKKIRPVNWLGKHSLAIMCVHYPFLQWWNPIVSEFDFYVNGGMLQKGILAVLSYLLAFAFSIPFVFLFQKTIPHLTGYKPLLSRYHFENIAT